MILFRGIFSLILLLVISTESPGSEHENNSNRYQAALKWGYLGSYCLSKGLTGLTEGYNNRVWGYGDAYYVTEGNFHIVETAKRVSWFGTGYLACMNMRDSDLSRWGKARRLVGAGLIGRNVFEFAYKIQRYNNAFEYEPYYNKSAIVFFSIKNGRLIEINIGTDETTGPLVDFAFMLLGMIIYK